MKTKISLISIALCIAGFIGCQNVSTLQTALQPGIWLQDSGYRTDIERIENTGTNLLIYYHEYGRSLNVSCAVIHAPGTVCDYGKVDRRWRHAYGISNNLIVDIGIQEPKAITTKNTNVTETITDWIYSQ